MLFSARSRTLSFILLMFICNTPGHAAECDPRDFKEFTFESYSEYEKLMFLSALSEQKLNEIQASHNGEMTIPYINIPIKGNFAYAKQASSQIKRLLSIDDSYQAETTILHSRLDSAGVDAYKACLMAKRTWIGLSSAELYSEEAVLTVHWFGGDQAEKGEIEDVEVSGGANTVGEWKKTINSNKSAFVKVKRDDLYKSATVKILVNGCEASITLPAKPKMTLDISSVRFPEIKVKAESWHGNAYENRTATGSYLAPNGSEIIAGTGAIVEQILVNQTEPCAVSINSAKSATVTCHSASPRKGLGTSAEAFGTVMIATPVQIQR